VQHIAENDAYWDQVRVCALVNRMCFIPTDIRYAAKSIPFSSTRPRTYSRSFRLKIVSLTRLSSLRAGDDISSEESSQSTGRSTRECRHARPRDNLPAVQPRLRPHVPLRANELRPLLRVVAHERRRHGAQRDQGGPELPARPAARPARGVRAGERAERV